MENGPYETCSLGPSFWSLEENGVRSFLLAGSKTALLIDTGFGTGNIRQAAMSLTNLPLQLVNTHADRDHIGCNNLFTQTWLHPAEYERYQNGSAGLAAPQPLWENTILDLGGRTLRVILIPGHTPGSIALLDEQNRLLISGDSVQAGGIYMFGHGRNLAAYRQSLRRLQSIRHSFDLVYPSHGPLPLEAAILDGLEKAALLLEEGRLPSEDCSIGDSTVRLYDGGVAKFLYASPK